MKIAYIAYWDVSQESGVLKKIVTQLRNWCDEGHTVKLFIQSFVLDVWSGLQDLSVEVVPAGKAWKQFSQVAELVKQVVAWQPDLVYWRFDRFYPATEKMMTRIPTVLEINTNDLTEYRLSRGLLAYWYQRLTRSRILSKASGIVSVTHELSTSFASFDRPSLVLANSIDLSQYPQLPAPQNSNTRLVFIGSPGLPWHGVDKVVWLAKQFPEWQFDLIGLQSTDLTEHPINIATHGILHRTEYEAIVTQADIAIGTLALYEKSMHEACPLKVREYLAYGLPTIIAYHETDFSKQVPFILQLPNTRTNVIDHRSTIKQFVDESKNNRVPRSEIAHLDTRYKEKQRLEFFSRLSNQ
ncbi:hypothetical protein QUF58_05685 [Anaerolineales bacterium HSG24]|nr:hypothetical protein [Anaerolineales bacterium HSG24]